MSPNPPLICQACRAENPPEVFYSDSPIWKCLHCEHRNIRKNERLQGLLGPQSRQKYGEMKDEAICLGAEVEVLKNENKRLKAEHDRVFQANERLRAALENAEKEMQVRDNQITQLLATNDKHVIAIENAERERDEAIKQLRECPTCEGLGGMQVVVSYNPVHGEQLETVECAECHGMGVSSWGQAIDRAERAEVALDAATQRQRERDAEIASWFVKNGGSAADVFHAILAAKPEDADGR